MRRILALLPALSFVVVVVGACEDSEGGGGRTFDAAATDAVFASDTSRVDAPVGIDAGTDVTVADAPADTSEAATDAAVAPIVVTSTAFNNGQAIPGLHTCTGGGIQNQSPPLVWTGAPANTQSYAIVVRDTTLAQAQNYHWVIYDLPAATTALPAGIPPGPAPASPAEAVGSKQTHWSFSANYSYLGPCPPVGGGAHNYVFTVYAFATATIPVPANTTDPAIADGVIQANKIASGSLTGTFQR